ncbi:MAG: tRNA 4-thiouridine(8) synthase ThiI [Roseburia sp.]|nr:tRNA 4-thiouridine(8) synthase ThiI [Anaeroplasma bactoclasticum]MCM1196527.1 tRNA 4-thiouridine(8) synthase ThiI [Roseburia sp.]MCM1557115.1 tRNA 4-thiouridine(8) synthase ThiI [Anaeroplasma bactoclasticum]
MLYNQILVRFGDLTLKGKNQKEFLRKLFELMALKMKGLNVEIENTHDRIYIHLNDVPAERVVKRLEYVSGISSYSFVVKCSNDLKEIKTTALELMKEIANKDITFKVETRRANKNYPLHSMEVTKQVAGYVLANHKLLHVDVHHPEVTLHLELKGNSCYLYNTEVRAMGGYPVGVAGKGLLMLSGGIDSPVAGYLAMKQGVEVECIHFESTPLTSIESAQKVIDLVKIMARYAPKNKINLHMVPFKELHMALLDNVLESYNITIMRRMMYRIASKLAEKKGCLCIINGESVGQVASQTLRSMNTINSVTNIPVLRPLCTYDKLDIIAISKKMECYDISIKPFEDCCTVYVPKAPATAPRIEKCEAYEKAFDYESMVNDAVEHTNSITIDVDSDIDLSMLGLEVREVIAALKNK